MRPLASALAKYLYQRDPQASPPQASSTWVSAPERNRPCSTHLGTNGTLRKCHLKFSLSLAQDTEDEREE